MEDMPPSDMPTTPRGLGRQLGHDAWPGPAPLLPTETEPVGAAVGVAVAGQVDGQQRPAEGQGDGVPGVGVLRPAVDQDELGRPVGAPEQAATPCGRARPRPSTRRTSGGPS